MGQNFYPPGEAGQAEFTENLRDKFPVHGPSHGFDEAEVLANTVDTTFMVWYLKVFCPALAKANRDNILFKKHIATGSSDLEMAFPSLPELSGRPPIPPAGIQNRAINRLKRLKLSPNFKMEVAGKDLWLIPPPAAKADPPSPILTLSTQRGETQTDVGVGYRKHKHDGIRLEVKCNNGEYELVTVTTAQPHLDQRPLQVANVPEIRTYRAQWWDKGVAHGEWSPPVSITVTPTGG